MAWTTPRTWVVGETLTAALGNTHWRDNLSWLGTDKPHCSAVRTTNQSIPNASLTTVTLNASDEWDVGNMHDPAGGNPSRITVPSGGGGIYQVVAMLTYTSAAGGAYDLNILKNGSAVTGAGTTGPLDTAGDTIANAAISVSLVATDYVELQTAQSSGGALNLTHARLQLLWYST